MANGGFYEGPDGRLYREDGSVIPQTTVTLRDPAFDIEGARQSGWGDDEIVDYLIQKNPDFDVEGARQSGYSDAEIGQFLSTGDGFSRSPYGAVGAIPRGINTALAGVLGAPVDVINAGLGLFGLGVEQPFGGSASIREGLNTGVSRIAQLLGGTGEYDATYEGLSELPPEERWGAVAGEVIGGSVPFAMAPVGLAAAGVRGPQWAQPIMNAAANTPGRFLGAEAAAIGGAAQGGALAEILAPGNEMARMGGEMAGAVLSPTAAIGRAAGGAGRSIRNLLSSFTEGGRSRRAAEYIVNAFQRTGEDPTEALEALRRAQDLQATGTVGQITGSPTVVAIENQLAGRSGQFASQRDTMGRQGIEDLLSAADALARSGDPQDLIAAARLRETAFNDMMAGRLAKAQADAQAAINRVGTSGQPGQVAASEDAARILNAAIDDARAVETGLWGQIDRTVPIEPSGTLARYMSLSDGSENAILLRGQRLDSDVEREIARIASGDEVTSGDLLLLRSNALELARGASAGATPNRRVAAAYGAIADAALDDIAAQMSSDAVDAARAYTRSMHEAFTQTFAGRGIASDRTGGDFLPPELLLERAFSGGGTRGDLQFQQLEDAAGFAQLGGPPQQTDLRPQMQGAQEDFLRSTAIRQGTSPETGEASANAIARFLAANETILGRFPSAREDIARALSAQRAAESVGRRGQFANRVLGTDSPFGRLLRGETPNAAVQAAFRGGQDNYMSLVNVARKGGPEAMDGLASATLDALLRDSSSSAGKFSFARFNEALNTPKTAWSKSPLETMVDEGVLDAGAADRLQEIIRRANLIENPPDARFDEAIVSPPDAITDLVARIIGARIGSAGVAGQGAPLIAAGAGSRTATNIFGRMPQARIQEAIIEIVKNPDLFEAAITRANTPDMRADLARQINAALINAGIDTGYEDPYRSGSSIPELLMQ